ncbi:MAG: hypothetical protein ABI870_09550 [Rhodanobacter sp.]
MRFRWPVWAAVAMLLCCCEIAQAQTAGKTNGATFRLLHTVGAEAEIVDAAGKRATLQTGDRFGDWTLMDVATGATPVVVLEDFVHRDDGHVLYVDTDGVRADLPKTAESTQDTTRGRALGHAIDEVKASASDLLGRQILVGSNDPSYVDVANAFPPITKMSSDTFDFLGTPDTADKVWFNYGGRSPNFDPAIYQPSVETVRKACEVRDGLVGGWLPVRRFVYPEASGAWTEMLAFAPFRIMNGNDRIQPVWYRVSRIENGRLKWSRYVDTYVAFPMRDVDDPRLARDFYAALGAFKADWETRLAQGIEVHLPDKRVENMARFGLVRSIMTRIGDYPKYGVLDRNYGGAEHDGFPDTFNVETTAMLDWGLLDRAGRYIENYFSHFVRDDGSLVYRGPETGQYGRMLTVAAQYVEDGGDPNLLLRQRRRLDAITNLLLGLRERALQLPAGDPAHGMIAAWSEADSVLEPDPARYMQPYFSNSAEAARGFLELGGVWARIGAQRRDPELMQWGHRLTEAGINLRRDLQTSIQSLVLHVDGETILPTIAGAKEPFHIVVARDHTDPQYRAYRANMEMLYSGLMTSQEADLIIDYREHHHDVLLGMPTAYGYSTGELAGFLSYGHGYGLLQQDRIREALLLLYSDMAHQYTRGAWLAPETRNVFEALPAAPYCTPAQLVASLMTRWLLVFEDQRSNTLWLGKGLPRAWLADGQVVDVQRVPTRWGMVGYRLVSYWRQKRINAVVGFPSAGLTVPTKLRLRPPDGAHLRSVIVNGRPWATFDAAAETITLPAGTAGRIELVARY